MFYDLNVPYSLNNNVDNQHKVAFLAELGYNVIALSHTLTGKLPTILTNPIPQKLPFSAPSNVQILRRTTLVITDSQQNFRISDLQATCDILAIRPTDDKTLQQACHSLDCDIISVDLSQRLQYRFKHKTLNDAISRGIRIEICYAGGMGDVNARRNLISNATQVMRATRGRGIIVSSEARDALGARAPWDVINLCVIWGLGQERGREALGREARSVVVAAGLRRSSFRGAVDVIYGGERPPAVEKDNEKEKTAKQQQASQIGGKNRTPKSKQTSTPGQNGQGKRKADTWQGTTPAKKRMSQQGKALDGISPAQPSHGKARPSN